MKFETLLEKNVEIHKKFDSLNAPRPVKFALGVLIVLPTFIYPPWTYPWGIILIMSKIFNKEDD